MFFKEHGSTKIEDGKSYFFDAKTYQWFLENHNSLTKCSILDQEWIDNNCHPNGSLFCPRCYRKHWLVDNYDFLCDGCNNLLLSYEPYRTTLLENKPTEEEIQRRLKFRQDLENFVKSDSLWYEDKQVYIFKEKLDNLGNFFFQFMDQEFKVNKPIILNMNEIVVK